MLLFLPGFCAALVLVGIHAYLGLHVIRRGVIFVDLAMAQAAALGSIVGFLYGFKPGTPINYAFSLGFTLFNALFFALGRSVYRRVPEEGIIGLNYAILSAAAVVLLNNAPHGAEQIKNLLAGQVLWVSWGTVLKTAGIYAVVGLIHFVWRKRFLQVSDDPEGARERGVKVWFWDFLFYATFGFVITSSVGIGGVLLVFTLLVGPGLLGASLARGIGKRLAISYAFGFVVTVVGFGMSLLTNFPTGATVVVTFGAFLLPVGLWHYVRSGRRRLLRGVLSVAALLVVAAVVGFTWKHGEAGPGHAHHGHGDKAPTAGAAKRADGAAKKSAVGETEKTARKQATNRERHGPIARLEVRAARGDATAKKRLLSILGGDTGHPFLVRQRAFEALCRVTGGKLPSCPFSGHILQYGGWLSRRAEEFQKRSAANAGPKPTSRKAKEAPER